MLTIRFSFRTQQSEGNSSSIGTKYWMQPFQWHSRKIIMNRDKTRKNRRTTSKFAFDTCQKRDKEENMRVYWQLASKSCNLQDILVAWLMRAQHTGLMPGCRLGRISHVTLSIQTAH